MIIVGVTFLTSQSGNFANSTDPIGEKELLVYLGKENTGNLFYCDLLKKTGKVVNLEKREINIVFFVFVSFL